MRSSLRKRPRTLLAASLLVLAVAGGCGWVSLHGAKPSVAFTAAKAAIRVEPPPPPAPAELQERLQTLAERYREPVGIAVTDVADRWTASVDGDSAYPQQSVVKLWTALAVMEAIDRGRMSLDQQVLVTQADRSVFYEPLGSKVGRNGFPTTIYDLLSRALTESDNTANDKLMSEVGGPAVVTKTVFDKGLKGIGVGGDEKMLQSMTAGVQWRPGLVGWKFKQARAELPDEVRDRALDAYLAAPPDGATPVGLTHALAALQRGELLSKESTDTFLTLMGAARTGNRRLKAGLPPGWSIAHKTGTGPDWRGASVGINDVGLITAPDGHVYAVAVMMRETRHPIGERMALMQAVARAVAEQWSRRDAPALVAGGYAAGQAGG